MDNDREVGGRLLTAWGLSEGLAEVVSHHEMESSDRPGGRLIDYVDSGNLIVQRIVDSESNEGGDNMEMINQPPIARLGMTEAQLASFEFEVEEAAEELQGALAI